MSDAPPRTPSPAAPPEAPAVVLYGVQDLVVVVQDGLTMVTTVDHADHLKTMLDQLPAEVREHT